MCYKRLTDANFTSVNLLRKTFFKWKKDEFKELGSGVLTSTTAEAYSHASSTLKTFIYHNRLEILQEWLALWNDRKSLIFCAFTNIQHSCQMVIQGPIRYIFTWSSFFYVRGVKSFNKCSLWRTMKWDLW